MRNERFTAELAAEKTLQAKIARLSKTEMFEYDRLISCIEQAASMGLSWFMVDASTRITARVYEILESDGFKVYDTTSEDEEEDTVESKMIKW